MNALEARLRGLQLMHAQAAASPGEISDTDALLLQGMQLSRKKPKPDGGEDNCRELAPVLGGAPDCRDASEPQEPHRAEASPLPTPQAPVARIIARKKLVRRNRGDHGR
jgi:hypothetical protein